MIILLERMTVIDIIKITTFTITTDIERTIDIEATVEIIHKIIIDQILDKDILIDLQVHTHLDQDMFHDQEIDLVLNHKESPLDDTITHIDLRLDQEITVQDPEHPHKTDNKTE